MTKEEAQQFVRKAISHAMARDGSSGGVIRMVVIDKTGVSTVNSLESPGRKEFLLQTYGKDITYSLSKSWGYSFDVWPQ